MQRGEEVRRTLELLGGRGYLSSCEQSQTLFLFDEAFPFADQVRQAESMHIHVRVDDTELLPQQFAEELGGRRENEKGGYVKFSLPEGGHVIFSSRPVSQEDLLEKAGQDRRPRPFLDHLGIDLRSDDEDTQALFAAIPQIAEQVGWKHVPQGGPENPVFCCHVEVAAKHWIYPPTDSGPIRTPLEFAWGRLKINDEEMGCDLRPANPQATSASEVPACEK